MERRLPLPGEQAVMNGALEAAPLASERQQSVGRGWGTEPKPGTKNQKEETGRRVEKPKLLPAKLGRVLVWKVSLGGSGFGKRWSP